MKLKLLAFAKAGYDYATIHASNFHFTVNESEQKKSKSANGSAIITDRESFQNYVWKEPEDFYNGRIEALSPYIPDGMKLLIMSPGGVLENVIDLMGYDNLCYMLTDDPDLVECVFDNVGTRLLKYYEIIADCPEVGAVIANDDWGFNTQTMISANDLRKYVFPYYKKIVELLHRKNKPVILHSCGRLQNVMNDIIDDIKFDGKHSYEDKIMPVEKAYEMYKDRITVVGGIDIDFLCRKRPEEIYNRSIQLLEQTGCMHYMLGSGNSIPVYIPNENYMSMIAAAIYNR